MLFTFNSLYDIIELDIKGGLQMKKKECAFCGKELIGYGNSPSPFTNKGEVCDECNTKYVIPARLESRRLQGELFEHTAEYATTTEYVIEVRPGEYVKNSKYDTTNIEEAKTFNSEDAAKIYISKNLPYGANIKPKGSCK